MLTAVQTAHQSSPTSRPARKAAAGARSEPERAHAAQPKTCPCGGGCPRCHAAGTNGSAGPVPSAEREQGMESRRSDGGWENTVAPPRVHDVLNSTGEPLDPDVRDRFGALLGHDFGRVQVHRDERAAQSAQAMNAVAYTVGADIAFDKGEYAPGTFKGNQLLAHELVHVAQQSSTGLRSGSPPQAEAEADSIARSLGSGMPRQVRFSTPQRLARQARTGGTVETGTTEADLESESVQQRQSDDHPAPVPRVEVDQLNYAFFFAGGPFGEAARAFLRKYYPDHRQVGAESFEEMFDRLWADTRNPKANHKFHIQEIILVTHANAEGGMKIALTRGDTQIDPKHRRFFNPWDVADLQQDFRKNLDKRFRQRRHEIVSQVMDSETQVVVRGCQFGQSDDAMLVLRSLFGGQPMVWAPTGYMGYETLPIGRSFLHSPEQAYDFLVQQGFLPIDLQPATDEEKRHYIARVFGLHGQIPAEFFVMGREHYADLHRLIDENKGRSDEAEPDKLRDPAVTPSVGDYWSLSSPNPMGEDTELDSLSMEEIETRARRLNNPYLPQNASMLRRLSAAWSRKVQEQFERTGELPGDPHDPLAGLPPGSLFGDPNITAGDAARYPGPPAPTRDIFETETLIEPKPDRARRQQAGEYDEPPSEIDLQQPAAATSVHAPPATSARSKRNPTGPGKTTTIQAPTPDQYHRSRDFSKDTPPPPPLQARDTPREEDVLSIDYSWLDSDLRDMLERNPHDSGHFWDILDLSLSAYSAPSMLIDALEGTALGLSMDVAGLVEPVVSFIGLLITISDATDAQIVGAQRLGVNLGFEAALLLAIEGQAGNITVDQMEAVVGNDPRLLAQITYSYPLGPEGCRENFRKGLAAVAAAMNAMMNRLDQEFRRHLQRFTHSSQELEQAYQAGIRAMRIEGWRLLYGASMQAKTPK